MLTYNTQLFKWRLYCFKLNDSQIFSQSIFLSDFESFYFIFKTSSPSILWLRHSCNSMSPMNLEQTFPRRWGFLPLPNVTTQKSCEINTLLYRRRKLRLRDIVQITRLGKLGFDPGVWVYASEDILSLFYPGMFQIGAAEFLSLSLSHTHTQQRILLKRSTRNKSKQEFQCKLFSWLPPTPPICPRFSKMS